MTRDSDSAGQGRGPLSMSGVSSFARQQPNGSDSRRKGPCGGQAAGASGSGGAQPRPRAGSGRAGPDRDLLLDSFHWAASGRSQAARLGARRPLEVRRWGDTSVAPGNPTRRAAHALGKGASVSDPADGAPTRTGRLGTLRRQPQDDHGPTSHG